MYGGLTMHRRPADRTNGIIFSRTTRHFAHIIYTQEEEHPCAAKKNYEHKSTTSNVIIYK